MLTIAVEGIDGAGKDTLIRYLNENLPNKPYVYAQCTDSLLGRHIRMKLKEEHTDDLLLSTAFMCEMMTTSDYIKRLIKKEDNNSNNILLLNRWVYSTLAYGCDNEEEMKYFSNIKHHILIPDIVIYLDLPITLAIERICKRTYKDFEKYEHSDILSKVKNKYENVFKYRMCFKNDTHFIRVDSSRSNYKYYALNHILNRCESY